MTGLKGIVGLTDGLRIYDALLDDAQACAGKVTNERYGDNGNRICTCGSCYYPVFSNEQLSAHINQPGLSFGLIILNDMEYQEDWYTGEYVEIIVAPGVTLTYPEYVSAHPIDICIYEGAKFVVNGNIISEDMGDTMIANAGILEVNGSIHCSCVTYGDHLLNVGSIIGNGSIGGSTLRAFSFKESSSTIAFTGCACDEHLDYHANFYVIRNGYKSRWAFVQECYDKHKDDEDKTSYIREALNRGLIR